MARGIGISLQGADADIRALPRANLEELSRFLERVGKINCFKPDGRPESRWKIFSNHLILDAREDAVKKALDRAQVLNTSSLMGYVAEPDSRDRLAEVALDISRRIAIKAGTYDAWVAARRKAVKAVADIMYAVPIFKGRHMVLGDLAADAELYAGIIASKGLNQTDKEAYGRHVKHAEEIMKVWYKGYGRAAEVGGIFYVYTAFSGIGGGLLRP